jgi:hypothetical protein
MSVKKLYFLGIILLVHLTHFGQNNNFYESKIADLGEIQIQYMDFGGEGPTLIWIQDFHNYFEEPYQDPRYYPVFKELAKDFRVLAPIRRGYGKSSDTKWGYDIATQSNDLLRFMDALGIEKAILYGRTPANQDMTWIAEHHPERIKGLIYDGNPILIGGCNDENITEFVENWSILAPDFEKEKQKKIMLSRIPWQPHFLSDPKYKINIPTLRFINQNYNWSNPNLQVLESGFLEQWIKNDLPGREEEISYLRELLKDSIRLKKLHQALIECDKTKAIEKGMQRVFGSNLQTINSTEKNFGSEDPIAYLKWKLPYIRSFIESLKN